MGKRMAMDVAAPRADVPTANGRVYHKGVLEDMVAQAQVGIAKGTLLVHADGSGGEPSLDDAVGVVREMALNDGVIRVVIEALDRAHPLPEVLLRSKVVTTVSEGSVEAGVVQPGAVLKCLRLGPPSAPERKEE